MVAAVVATEVKARPQVLQVELPPVGPDEVRIRVVAAGVCHSDLSLYNGTLKTPLPLLLGHEAAGIVTEVGDRVSSRAVGDRVVVNWAPACRACWFCRDGEPHLCPQSALTGRVAGTLADGTELAPALGVGGMAEELVLPERATVAVPEHVPLDAAALLGCAVLTGTGAVRNTARVRSGESVVVIGLGGVGLSAVTGARLAGAGPIIAIDVSPDKQDLARAAGATHFVESAETKPLQKQIRALTGGRGADHVFECVGRAATIRLAWDLARRGGTAVVVGVGGYDEQVSFIPMELFHQSRTLTSSVYGASDPERDIPHLCDHIALGQLDLESLITHRCGLEGAADAFERMAAGEGARTLIEISDP